MTLPPEAQPPGPEATLQDLTLRAIDVYANKRRLDNHARRVLLNAIQDLTLCFISALNEVREKAPTTEGANAVEKLLADLTQMRLERDEARDWAEVLAASRAEVAPHRRRHFSPTLRFRILEHMKTYMLTIEQTAQRFVLTAQTIRNWLGELNANPDAKTIGRLLLDCVPPVRRFADVVRRLVHRMHEMGVGGKKKIAETIVRLGWKIDASTVGRIVKKPRPAPEPTSSPEKTDSRPTTVRGDYPNHLVLIDITQIPLLFPFLHIHVAVVLDAFSRLVLAASVHFLEPSARDMIRLFDRAIRRHGKPRHLVTDQGSQFTAPAFKAFVKSQGVLQRFGKVGEFHSIGLIDRLFRTLKTSLGVSRRRPWSFRGVTDFTRRLEIAFVHYAYARPHAGIGGLTPIERYYGIRGHLPTPTSPPRGRVGEVRAGLPVEIAYLDPDNDAFPIVVPKAA